VNFLKQILSEPGPNGTGSFSRTMSAIIDLATLGWITFVVAHTRAIPDLSGPLVFMTTGHTSLYGLNKIVTKVGKN